jgi:hypothetical protein
MLKKISFLIVIVFSLNLLFSNEFIPGKVVFKMDIPFSFIDVVDGTVVTDQSWFNDISNFFQFEEMYLLIENSIEFDRTYVVRFDEETDVFTVIDSLNNKIEVVFAETVGKAVLLQNDPQFYLQWALQNIDAHPT